MPKAETPEQKQEFWEIINSQNFHRDVLAPAIAAEDVIVRSTISFVETTPMPFTEAELQDIYMDLEGMIVKKYSLPSELSYLTFKLCRDMIELGEFNND